MKTTLNRLQALEAELTPKQVILRMLDKMAEFQTLDEYIAWSYTDDALKRMDESRENMYEAARRRTNSKDPREQNKSCHKVHRQFHFLYDIAMMPCMQQDRDRFRYLYHISTVAHLLSSLWRTFRQDEVKTIMDDLKQARGIAEPLLIELICDRLASETIARKYFEGRSLLFSQQWRFLERSTEHVEQLIENLNEAVDLMQALEPEREAWQALKINLDAIQAMAGEKAVFQVEQIEQNAQIALYGAEGKHDEAIRLFQRMIHPTS